jgi:hypothetical protein
MKTEWSTLFRSALLVFVLGTQGVTSFASEGADLAKVLDQNAPALVTVQLVLQVRMSGPMAQVMGESQGLEAETVCPMIDAQGLILCSNTQLNGYTGIMQRVTGRMGFSSDLSASPSQIKVLVSGEAKPLAARLVVRDTDLDLVWLQIEEPGDRQFPYIDFARSATPRIGENVFALRRLDRFFDRNPALLETRIGGVTQKPRLLYIPSASFEGNLGLPILTTGGQPVGLLVLQVPDDAGLHEVSGFSLEMMLWSARMQDIGRGVILPAEEILKATRRAMASVSEERTGS